MRTSDTNSESAIIALKALAWTLAEPNRAGRLIAITGLDPDDLRQRAAEPAVLAASLQFLESHEPDLVACADALGTTPDALVRARMELDA